MVFYGAIVVTSALNMAVIASVTALTALNATTTAAMGAALIGGVFTLTAALLVTRRSTKQQLQSIEVKVDGRLEAALVKIDGLQALVATLTGTNAPPLVSGLNQPAQGTPGTTTVTTVTETPAEVFNDPPAPPPA